MTEQRANRFPTIEFGSPEEIVRPVGAQVLLTQLMQNPKDNLAKAQTYYSSKHPG